MSSGGRRRVLGERPFRGAIDLRTNNDRLRLARIDSVDAERGICCLEWLDHPGNRVDVEITQDNWNSWHMPIENQVVICGFDVKDRALILRFMPVGYQARHGDPSEGAFEPEDAMRRLEAGEHFWKSAGGAELYMDQNGDIVLSSGAGTYWKLTANDILSQNSETWRARNEAGQLVMGIVRRIEEFANVGETQSRSKIVTYDGSNIVDGGQALVEYQLKIAETADADPTTPNIDDPIVTLTLGTVVDGDGNPVDKDGSVVAAGADDAIAIDIDTRSGIGFRLSVMKDGDVELKVKSDKIVRITGGGASQAVVLADFIDDFNDLVSAFNSHGHIAQGPASPTTTPLFTPGATTPVTASMADKDDRSSDNFETE